MSSTADATHEDVLILIIEDDRPIQNFIAATLRANGFAVISAETGTAGVALAYGRSPDIVLLDLGLPDFDGMELLRRIREGLQTPVIIVSARGNEKAKVAALDGGADDYLSKPFGTAELLARIRVALRWSHRAEARNAEATEHPVRIGALSFDAARREVLVNGNRVHLTPIEFRLLEELVRERGKVLTHSYLVARVWGPGQPVDRHNVRVFMASLRRKIEINPATPQIILTEVGIGYRLNDEE